VSQDAPVTKVDENPPTDTGDIVETKLPRESRTHAETDDRKHIVSAGAYRRQRLNKK